MTSLNLPAKMDFTMGSTEQKMDMTLDDIIKQTRKVKKQRVPIKSRNKSGITPAQRAANASSAKAALQRSVAVRSSKLRQGKYAEARARNGISTFVATQAAGKRAFATPVTSRNRAWVKSSDLRRNNFTRQRTGPPGQKLNPFTAAAGNMKISVFNNGSKSGGQKFPRGSFRRRNLPNNTGRQVQSGQPNTDRMEVEYGPQAQKSKARTLDSLFAEIKERRNNQSRAVQTFTAMDRGSRRGGRSGFQGRGGFTGWRNQAGL